MDSNSGSQKDGERQIGFDNAAIAPSKDLPEIHQPPIQCDNLGKDEEGYFCVIAALEGFGHSTCPHAEKPFVFTNNGLSGPRAADFVWKGGGDGVCQDFEPVKGKLGFEKGKG